MSVLHLPASSLSEDDRSLSPVSAPNGEAHARELTLDLMSDMTGPAPQGAVPMPPGPGVVVAEFCGIDEQGHPRIRLPNATAPVIARTTIALPRRAAGQQALVFHDASASGGPIITGLLREPQPLAAEPSAMPFELEIDDERVVLNAGRQLVLRCGQASITLTREGKILLRGTYVCSQSSGVHRINGASVEIN
ncbi:DUF6484 domain-containing protein [Roseateles amylovorans]|uniref:DUF6484 domain-containing protein n=1 Tax=Roseateles amylovorans TaxID=2978473 RepID=A0ABY6B148_9BURK|nr:DUF6484 domain-containing protein [Roseateles amylovorans]UXH78775.1 DUF6484 domain-containing protein [Roseateles amylovorans]